MIDTIIVLLTSVINFLLGAFVLIRNPKAAVNRVFAAFSGSLIIWTIFNFLSDQLNSNNLIFTRLTFVSAVFISISLLQLSNLFPDNKPLITKRIQTLEFWLAFVIVLICLSPYLVPSVVKNNNSPGIALTVGPLYYSYLVYILHILGYIIINFKKRFKSSNVIQKIQIKFLLSGIILYAILAIASNLILPLIVDDWSSSRYGPIFTLLFVASTAYAIIRHKLLDIRLIVARSIAYILLLSSIIGIYALSIYFLTNIFFSSETYFSEKILPLIIAGLVALSIPYLRNLFSRLTNKFFYRDAYDTQVVLDKVSAVIVGNVEPHKVQRGTLAALSDALRPTYMVFLLQTSNGTLKKGDNVGQQWKIHAPELLEKVLNKLGRKITVYDELDESYEYRDVLRNEDIGVVAPLVTKDEIIGYLLVGPKKSGNVYNSQDVGLLNITSNELAVALQNAQRFEEIQAFNITLQEKVTQATKELSSTNRRLIALDEAKDEFISMASHQLRTPLTSIKGYLSMLLEGDLGKVPKQQQKALSEAFGSSQRMVYLISDFLNVSRIKTGKFTIEPAEINLPQVVEEEITQLREIAEAKNIKIIYDPPGDFPIVKLDDNKIRQVMMNMMDNAIYYTPVDGKITIQLYVNDKELVFKVVDTGIGVPRKEQHKLFTKFYRAGNARKVRPDGTGLGLFMAQKIVIAQEGAVIFESVEGKGSTFGFRFPLKKIKA